jgi:hypothetical protein
LGGCHVELNVVKRTARGDAASHDPFGWAHAEFQA